jgi:hypothetical protein
LIFAASKGYPNILLSITDKPISHSLILKAMQEANVAILPYKVNANLKYRIPTKLYEYAAFQLPMLIPENEVWVQFLKSYHAGFAINFNAESTSAFARKLLSTLFYDKGDLADIYWETEEIKLLKVIDSLV